MWMSLHNSLPRWRGRLEPHWRGFAQSTSAQAFNLLGIIAGSILAESYDVFSRYPWALLMFPGLLSNRGAIGGLFSGRLSTGLHLGTVMPNVRGNTKDAYLLLSSIVTLTGLSAALILVGVTIYSVCIYRIGLKELYQLFLVLFTTLGLSILVITPTTFLTSIHAYNRGLDPDMVVYPVTSTTADVSISFIYVSMLRLLARDHPLGNLAMLSVAASFIGAAAWVHIRSRGKAEYDKTLREFSGTLVIVTLIVTLTGSMLGRISTRIGDTAEIYAIYPAMIDTVGDVGSIIGSTATTKLILGYYEAELSSLKSHMGEVAYAWGGSLLLFALYAIISGTAYGFKGIRSLLAVVILTNVLVVPLISLVSFSVAIVSFNRGLDPDNFVIPFETSLADSLTTVFLYLMILVWY